MSSTSIAVPPNAQAVNVRVAFALNGRRSLYGHRVGPFIYDERRDVFLFDSRTFSLEEWERQADTLMLRYGKHRPKILVEVDWTIAEPAPEGTADVVVEGGKEGAAESAASESTPATDEVPAAIEAQPAVEVQADPEPVPAPDPEPAASVEAAPVASAPPSARRRRPATVTPSATPAPDEA